MNRWAKTLAQSHTADPSDPSDLEAPGLDYLSQRCGAHPLYDWPCARRALGGESEMFCEPALIMYAI